MEATFLWGMISLICGGFMLVYGASLIRVVLAFFGFFVGFVVATLVMEWLGLAADNAWLQLLVEVVLGAILGLVFYNLVSLTVYLAGGILGAGLGAFIIGALNLQADWLAVGIIIVAAVIGVVFGRNLGDWLPVLAASVAGAYASVVGIGLLFRTAEVAEQTNRLMPTGSAPIVVFLFLLAVGTLAQMQIRDLRRRLVRR
jgi:hypothetical protein